MSIWNRLFRRGERVPELTVDTPGLIVVAEAFDPAEAASAVLDRSTSLRRDDLAVLRHHLVFPGDQVERARSLLAQDGWTLRPAPPADSADTDAAGERLYALRVQRLDAMHCAQEQSRMAGLGARLRGDSLGWDALQPRQV
jgi:hypothetical protein